MFSDFYSILQNATESEGTVLAPFQLNEKVFAKTSKNVQAHKKKILYISNEKNCILITIQYVI